MVEIGDQKVKWSDERAAWLSAWRSPVTGDDDLFALSNPLHELRQMRFGFGKILRERGISGLTKLVYLNTTM